MSIAELVYEQVKALPEPLAREVLDFIGFLRERGERRDWRDLMSAQEASLGVIRLRQSPQTNSSTASAPAPAADLPAVSRPVARSS